MTTTRTAPTAMFAHHDRGLTTPTCKESMMADPDATQPPAPREQIALIRSLAGHAEGHEARALAEIADVLAGASLAELLLARAGGGA